MILQIMAVYDSKARAFLIPFFCAHTDVGRRAFSDAANNPGHQVGAHPEDFTLFHLGTFDDDNAVFKLLAQYHNCGLAAQLKKGVIDVPSQVASEQVGNAAQLRAGSEGGDPA